MVEVGYGRGRVVYWTQDVFSPLLLVHGVCLNSPK